MTTTQSNPSPPPTGGPPKRRFKNYLLDPRFQLKYTTMVVAVTLVVASVLGYFVYQYARGQHELLVTNQMMEQQDDSLRKLIEDSSQADMVKVRLFILLGIAALTLVLGTTGILVTHRLVGPAYRMKRLFRDVRDGRLKVTARLRKGDELKDVFDEYEEMIDALRARQLQEISQLDGAIAAAQTAGTPDQVLSEFRALRDRMQGELD